MRKNILIISSDYTGHGHKSITESLCERIKISHNVNIHVQDGFSLGGKLLINVGKSYGPITRSAEKLWEMIWNLSALKPSLVNQLIESVIKKNFLKLINEIKPDLILSVHPNFNGSILNILEKQKIKIPFVTLIADLVDIYPLWADKRADFIICPTVESKNRCIEYGISEDKLKVLGFPVRSRFINQHKKTNEGIEFTKDTPLDCLIMSGGEGVGNMQKIAENLLDHFNCTVKVVAGRNIKLKETLEQSLKDKYGDKVMIYGFTKNIQDLMFSSDIAFTRGSPNVMFEAIAANLPIIITGALPGQEKHNPAFAEKYHLGVVCKNTNEIKSHIESLLDNNGEKFKRIKSSQKRYFNPNAAEDILQFLAQVANGLADTEKVSLYVN